MLRIYDTAVAPHRPDQFFGGCIDLHLSSPANVFQKTFYQLLIIAIVNSAFLKPLPVAKLLQIFFHAFFDILLNVLQQLRF